LLPPASTIKNGSSGAKMIFFEARCRCNERINAAYNSTGKRAFKSLFCCVLLTKDTKQVKEAELEEV